jgi:hypothetical protein
MQLEVSRQVGFKTSMADVIQYLINHYLRTKHVR